MLKLPSRCLVWSYSARESWRPVRDHEHWRWQDGPGPVNPDLCGSGRMCPGVTTPYSYLGECGFNMKSSDFLCGPHFLLLTHWGSKHTWGLDSVFVALPVCSLRYVQFCSLCFSLNVLYLQPFLLHRHICNQSLIAGPIDSLPFCFLIKIGKILGPKDVCKAFAAYCPQMHSPYHVKGTCFLFSYQDWVKPSPKTS